MTDLDTTANAQTDIVADEAQSPAPRDYEAEARQHGWTPQEEFKGDPDRWTDAETFVKRADEVMPLLKKQNSNLKAQIDQLNRTVKRLAKAEQSAYDNAIRDLKAQAEQAVESGDLETYRKVDADLTALQKEASADASPNDAAALDAFDTFRETNLWFDKGALPSASEVEVEARLFADRLAEKYARQGLPNEMEPADFFAKIAEETEARFPLLKAKKTREKPPSAVAGVTVPGAGRSAKTGANLPPEARRQAERFFNQGIIKGKDLTDALNKYAASYDWN